ncbi:acyl-CoA dehydratase activase [candidate division KSB1 bacterium]|nr:acyl-CoA dehydratase activase [candidate division KSB1 bacterium]
MAQTVIGIDLGSRTTKIVRLAADTILDTEIFETGHDPLPRLRTILARHPDAAIMATGYGRHLICEHFGAQRVTEIKACARGALHFFPDCRTVLDVGGQDCKVIALDESRRILDFQMNDRCAAGTGKFIEVMAQTFDLDLTAFIQIAGSATDYVTINSMCTVFAESEVVSLITSGKSRAAIARGLHLAVAKRLAAMLMKIPIEDVVLFVGGGARNDCLTQLITELLTRKIVRPENPQIVTALGAALLLNENPILNG